MKLRRELSRLAHKTSPIFSSSAKREREIFLRLLRHESERESGGSTCFHCRKSHQVTAFWRELFASPSRVRLDGAGAYYRNRKKEAKDFKKGKELGQNSSPKTVP